MPFPASPAPTTAAAEKGEEIPPARRNREEEEEPEADEAKVARWAYSLFGTPTDSEPEKEQPEPSCPPFPSSSSSSSDDDEDFTAEGLRARDAALSVSKSVVSLSASIDEDPQFTFACTGTVVAHKGPATWIITSAALIRKRESDTEVHETSDVKIEVLLPNRKVVGQLLMYDLQYNVAIISIEHQADLPVVVFSDLPDSYFLTPCPVVAIARKFESGRLQMKRGETFRTVCKLDCDELMVSTCQIEQIFIGGLLMDLEKRIVGMNFIDDKTTPFLPVEVVGRCMRHFVTYGKVKRPWLGIRGRSFHLLELAKLQQICDQFPKPPSGVFVDMIHEASSPYCEGIEVGDILNQLNGVVLHSAAQLTSMLLDKMEVVSHTDEQVILKACIQRPRDCATFSTDLKVVECPPGECDPLYKNRWRLPQPKVYWWGPPELSECVDDSDSAPYPEIWGPDAN